MCPSRWLVPLACVPALFTLARGTTDFALTRPAGIRHALATNADGQELTLLLWRVQSAPGPQHAVLESQGLTVPVQVDDTALRPGDTALAPGDVVTVEGTFRASDQSVVAARVTVHHWRRAKQALGLGGAVLSILWLPFAFRIEDGALVERG